MATGKETKKTLQEHLDYINDCLEGDSEQNPDYKRKLGYKEAVEALQWALA